MTTVLRLDHVTKAFGPVKVIQDVSVDVIPDRVRVLLGENGAGTVSYTHLTLPTKRIV